MRTFAPALHAFCAGGDVKGMAARSDDVETTGGAAKDTIDEAVHRQRLAQRATAGRLYNMPKPTIAVLPGAAAGAGLSLACLLYTSPSPRDKRQSRMPSSA